ncbi:MAG: hypothetical protein K2P76_00850 [Lachnospiraceae bacterium]|nr:hypothetical protein [Lachnospiraceae bacterium]
MRRERASCRKQLIDCKSKEEIEKLKMTKMGHYLAEEKEGTALSDVSLSGETIDLKF